MYPEAGGSSSLRAARLQRVLVLLRRLGPDAQLHHHGRDLGVLRAALPGRLLGAAAAQSPATSSAASSWSSLLGAAQHRRRQGVGRLNVLLARRGLRDAGAARVIGVCPGLLAGHADRQRPPRTSRRRWSDFLIAIPVGDGRLHGDRDDLEHGRGGEATTAKTIPRAIGGVVVRGDRRSTRSCRRSRCRRCRSQQRRRRCWRCPRSRAATPTTRCSASSRTSTSGSLQHAAEIYVGILAATILFIATNAGHHRRVAADLLDGPAPPAARAPARAAPEVPHAVHRDHRLRADRLRHDHPGPGRLPRQRSTRSARCCRSRSRTWR